MKKKTKKIYIVIFDQTILKLNFNIFKNKIK